MRIFLNKIISNHINKEISPHYQIIPMNHCRSHLLAVSWPCLPTTKTGTNWKAQTYLVRHHFQDIYVCRHEIRISHIAHLCRAMCKTFHKKSWRFIAPQLMIDNILPSTQRKELWRYIFFCCINLCRSVQGQGIQAVHVVIKRYCSACQWKCFSYTLWGIERVYCT